MRLTGCFFTGQPVCHGICTPSTAGVAELCRHSLPSTALEDVSSRSPLERNKREMLYTLITFPQWLSKTTVRLKLLCPGWDWKKVPTALQRKGNTESTVCPLSKASQQGRNNQVFMWYGAYSGQPQYCPHRPPPSLFLWIKHMVTLRHPHNPRVCASTSLNTSWPTKWMSSLKQTDGAMSSLTCPFNTIIFQVFVPLAGL